MSPLLDYISQPQSAIANFRLALFYEDLGYTAAAAGFYIRAAEYADDTLAYESLLRLSNCFSKQGSRVHLNKGILLRAISHQPARPEAYFLLSQLYEHNKDWEESYTFAVMGQRVPEDHPSLLTNVDYPGRYALVFQQAVAAWWIGLFGEALDLFRKLRRDPTMLPIHIKAVADNLKRLDGTIWFDSLEYDAVQDYERLRVKFPGVRGIVRNYSQAFQDIFVLTMANGKRNGRFFEIGCGDPEFRSNTKLLEEFGWTGISVDTDAALTAKFAGLRKSKVITADATQLDYGKLMTADYDYLQIDCEPAATSLAVLLRIPFDQRRFAVITFEHDAYQGVESEDVRARSRRYLESHGYVLVAGNVAYNRYDAFEDWWVHPALADVKIAERVRVVGDAVKKADRILLT